MSSQSDAKHIYSQIGENIALARKSRNLTQKQIADRLGVTQTAIASYEIGRRRIPIPHLLQIAKALNMYVEDLLPIEEKKRGPVSQVDKELSKVKSLPDSQQKLILELIQSVINNTKVS